MPTRRTLLSGLAALPLVPVLGRSAYAAGTPVQPDSLRTQTGDLVVQPVNHATVIFSFGSDIIYVDPVGGGPRYMAFNKPTSIVITHEHPDHFDVPTLEALPTAKLIIAPQKVVDALPADLKAKAKVMKNGDSGDIDGIPVAAVPAYNITPDRLKYHPKGVGNGYVFTFGGGKVYVAGDTEDTPEMRAMVGIGAAFLPMNLPFTMTGEQAASAVKAFKPSIVYPYHYGKDGTEPQKFAEALKGVGGIDIRQRDWYAYS